MVYHQLEEFLHPFISFPPQSAAKQNEALSLVADSTAMTVDDAAIIRLICSFPTLSVSSHLTFCWCLCMVPPHAVQKRDLTLLISESYCDTFIT